MKTKKLFSGVKIDKDVIRDFAFLFFISYVSGLVMSTLNSVFQFTETTFVFSFALLNYIVIFIGFCLVASWTLNNRFSHLVSVGMLLIFLTVFEQFINQNIQYIIYPVIAIVAMIPISWRITECIKSDKIKI